MTPKKCSCFFFMQECSDSDQKCLSISNHSIQSQLQLQYIYIYSYLSILPMNDKIIYHGLYSQKIIAAVHFLHVKFNKQSQILWKNSHYYNKNALVRGDNQRHHIQRASPYKKPLFIRTLPISPIFFLCS